MTYREADVAAIEAAWDGRDRSALAEIGGRLGIQLELDALRSVMNRAGKAVRRRDVIATLLAATTHAIGIAVFDWDGWICLAVRGDRIAIELGKGSSPSRAWADLKPWLRHLESNRARCEKWAADPCRITFARLAVAAAPIVPIRDEAELVKQIVERPDDRALRSVLADLLVDTPRGKLMRLEAEIAALPSPHPERLKRETVIGVVLKQHRLALAGADVVEHTSDYKFAGGFVNDVTMTAAAFRDHGARLFAQQPIRRLTLMPVNDAAIKTLAKAPIHLLRELCIHLRRMRPVSLAPLEGKRFDRLEVLELHYIAGVDESFPTKIDAPMLRTISIK